MQLPLTAKAIGHHAGNMPFFTPVFVYLFAWLWMAVSSFATILMQEQFERPQVPYHFYFFGAVWSHFFFKKKRLY